MSPDFLMHLRVPFNRAMHLRSGCATSLIRMSDKCRHAKLIKVKLHYILVLIVRTDVNAIARESQEFNAKRKFSGKEVKKNEGKKKGKNDGCSESIRN